MINTLKNNGKSLHDQMIRNHAVSRIAAHPPSIEIASIANSMNRGGASHATDILPLTQRPSIFLEMTGGAQ